MSATQPAYFHLQEFSDGGVLLVGGRLYTYTQGTTALKVAYTDPAGAVPQTYTADGLGGQYIALNARGELPAPLYLAIGPYDIALKRADGSTVWTRRADPTIGDSPSGASMVGADDGAAGTLFTTVAGFIAKVMSSAGASLIGFIQAGVGAVIRTLQSKARESKSVFDFMTEAQITDVQAGTLTYDLITQLRAASAAILVTGGTLRVRAGYYRITDSWEIGLPEFDSYEFMLNRTDALADPDFAAHRIPANVTSNQARPGVTIEFDENAFLVADFAPAAFKPVLAYHLPAAFRKEGRLINPTVISRAMMAGGKYYFDAVAAPQTNKLLGIYLSAGAKEVVKPFVSGCQHGILAVNAYWSSLTNSRVEWAGGDGINYAQANAAKIDNLVVWNSTRGLVFDGSASKVSGINCQQVVNEITVFLADCTTFGPGYLEDVSATAGAGYAVTLGTAAGTIKLTSCTFTGIRVGARRPGKASYRIWGSLNATFTGCRAYGGTVDYDTASYGSQFGCDFPVVATNRKFVVSTNGGGLTWPSFNLANSDYGVQGPWMFAIIGVAPGPIGAGASANYDYVLPAALDGMNSGNACVTYTSGGDARLVLSTRLLFTTPKKLRLTFANNTAAAIDPGSANLSATVFGGI